MPSSLFSRPGSPRQTQQNRPQSTRRNPSQNPLQQAIALLKSKTPEEAAALLSTQYPELGDFIAANRGKSINQVLRENNISVADIKNLLAQIR